MTQFIEPEEVTRLVANVIQTYAVLENEGIKCPIKKMF